MNRVTMLVLGTVLGCVPYATAYPIQMTMVATRIAVSVDGGPNTIVDLTFVFGADTANLLVGGGYNGSDRYPNLTAYVSSTALGYVNVPATTPLSVDIGDLHLTVPVIVNAVAITGPVAAVGLGSMAAIGTWNRVSSTGPLNGGSSFCINCGFLTVTLSNGHNITFPNEFSTFPPGNFPWFQAVVPDDAFQLKYFNTNYGSGQVIVSNSGTMTTGGNVSDDSDGTICANFYSFDPNEEMQTCCSCPVTPNGLSSLNVLEDIVAQNLIVNPSSAITVKLLFTKKNMQNAGGACDPTLATAGNLARGGLAWGTNLRNVTFQGSPPTAVSAVTETTFSKAGLSAGELTKLTTYCRYIKILGSSVSGICKSCQAGARAAIGR